MEILKIFWENIRAFIPTAAAIAGTIIVLLAFKLIFEKRYSFFSEKRFRFQIIMALLGFAGLLVIILVLPINDTSRGQLLSLLGILLSAAIALSSTTILGNAMAGIMLRVIRGFRSGDFIRVGEHFGRISEQGIFHLEIQNEDRDLTSLPNLYLVTNPVKVIRSSGTFVSATVSLGYDIPRTKIERLLLEAAEAAELTDPFVQILELGDFSITYRVAGLLTEVKQILTSRSRLHAMMLDKLHENGVEIVSPNFMNTRAISIEKSVIPQRDYLPAEAEKSEKLPEAKLFDKAEEAESKEKLLERFETAGKEIDEVKKLIDESGDEKERETLQESLKNLQARRELLEEIIKKRQDE